VRLFRRIARPTFRILYRVLGRVKVWGWENIPAQGGYLVVANHVSIYDPPLVIAFWPRELEVAGAVDVLDRPFQVWFMRQYGALWVHRGQVDRRLLEEMVGLLRAGLPVLIFPEGGRSHVPGLRAGWPGAGLPPVCSPCRGSPSTCAGKC
jgi:1-acyl-sn-glycerol-3-phosphate acyltransferase